MEQRIKQVLNLYFTSYADKFTITTIPVKEARHTNNPLVIRPGIYIFWTENTIWKVGKHLINVRKRSLQHIGDNTKSGIYEMNSLEENPQAFITYLTINSNEDEYWIPSLEMLCEMKLSPLIRSKRR
ncbi:MAG TPA: hypothetical protein PK289_02085 [Bacteroidia bacterium]|nr:hypothetical protein [Bacteroidia bacterium]HRG51982.1 hypothetical protein [Bacteroidia bacterium]